MIHTYTYMFADKGEQEMNGLDNAITCCGQSWSGYGCRVCNDAEFDKAMHDNIEANYTDEVDEYDN